MSNARRLIPTTLVTLCAAAGVLAFAGAPALAASTRSVIGHFGPGGPGVGVFSNPQSIAVEQSSGDVYVYDAGHGFASDRRADYDPDSARLARLRTLQLFSRSSSVRSEM